MEDQVLAHTRTFSSAKTFLGAALCALTVLLPAPFSAQAQPCVAAPADLVSWWRAEGNTGDSVGSNAGTPAGVVTYEPGKVGQAFSFDGADSYVNIPSSGSVNFSGNMPMTIEAWVYRTGSASVMHILGKRPGCSSSVQYQLAFDGGNGLHFYSEGAVVATHQQLPLNTWRHLAVTYDGTMFVLYIDGQVAASGSGSLGSATTAPLKIGGSGDCGATFAGLVDEVSIYARGLSSAEIQAIYNAGAAGKCTAPTPPSIFSHPISQTVFAGAAATFTVSAGGQQPLSYQWFFNDTDVVDGATNSSLVLTNVLLVQAGNYSVQVSNTNGVALSSNAVLTVNPPGSCLTPSSGLVSWWRAEGNTGDSVGSNSGTPAGVVTYAPGKVGQAFSFDGADSYVNIPSSGSVNFSGNMPMTMEAWVYRTGSASVMHILGKRPGCSFSVQYQLAFDEVNGLHFYSEGAVVATHQQLPLNTWRHLAVTYDGTMFVLYIDGQVAASGSGSLGSATTAPLKIGGSGDCGATFAGLVDEVSIYARGLSSAEIQAIYNAGAAGKCPVTIASFIISQPTDRVATVGATTTFNFAAGGSAPLSYQWSFNTTNINGATNASLTLSNVQFSQAGSYSVVVSNAVDSATSSNALLTVNFPPATVRVVSTNVMAGGLVTVPVVLVANGNENALGFSLNFNTQRLTFAGVSLGAGAAGATLLPNMSQTNLGRLGLAVSLPSGTSFTAGMQEVARVDFISPVLSGVAPVNTTISFGNSPTIRQLSDAQAQALSATYANGTVTLTPSDIEGDVAPRPAGDRNFTITDWVQVGRFVAGLDTAVNGGEFQRADCAPHGTLGDGILKVTDWVQAGRYAAGLDALTVVGGPTSPTGSGGRPSGDSSSQGGGITVASARQVSVGSPTAIQGLTVTFPVNLEAQGNETALGFSLSFDAAVFTYSGSSLGGGAGGAALNVNTSQIGSGKLGVTLGLPTGSFSAGSRELVKVKLTPNATVIGNYGVGFGDQPLPRGISDPAGDELTADYVPGTVVVNPLPSLTIRSSGASVSLSWPVWAEGFNLQTSDSNVLVPGNWTNVVATLQTNAGNIVLTIPASETTKFFRLLHP